MIKAITFHIVITNIQIQTCFKLILEKVLTVKLLMLCDRIYIFYENFRPLLAFNVLLLYLLLFLFYLSNILVLVSSQLIRDRSHSGNKFKNISKIPEFSRFGSILRPGRSPT